MRGRLMVVLAVGVGVACGGKPQASSPAPVEGAPEERPTPTPEPTGDRVPPAPPAPSAACDPGHTVLATAANHPPLLGRSPGGRFLVFNSHLFEVATRRTLALGGYPIAVTPDEQRAFFHSEDYRAPGLFEVRLSDGAVRTLVRGSFSIVRSNKDASALVAMTHGKEVVLVYPDTGEVRRLGQNNSGWVHTDDDTHYAFYSGDNVVLMDTARRAEVRLGPVRSATLLPGKRAALYSDEQNQVWGWRPDAPPILLGQGQTHLYLPEGSLWFVPEGRQVRGTLFVDRQGTARLWEVETGHVRTLGTQVLFARLSPSGSLAYVLERGPEEHNVLRLIDLESGRTQQWETRAALVSGSFSASGRYVAFHEEGLRPDGQVEQWIRLWDTKRGEEVALSRQPNASPLNGCMLTFSRDESVLQASCNDAEEVLYSIATGQELFASTKSLVPAEGAYSFWGQDGVFYMRERAHLGPPDGALWAWNPDTKTELLLGHQTHSFCFAGEVHVYGGDQRDHDTPFTLRGWHAKSGRQWTIAENARWAQCLDPQGPAVLVLRDARPRESESRGYNLEWANVVTGTTQRLATDAVSHHVTKDEVFYTTSAGLCVAPRPDASRDPGRP